MRLSADGYFYLHMASGNAVPRPYALRWFIPWALGPHPRRFVVLTYASLVATPLLAWLYFGAMGLEGWQRIFAAALLSSLPGVWRASLMFPILIDAPNFALTLAVAWLVRSGHWMIAAPFMLVLGGVRETGPIFAALWAWSPIPLVGLIAVGWWRRHAAPNMPHLEHPVREALMIRRALGPDGTLYLRPWGAALVGLLHPSWPLVATVLVAHAQLLLAVDCVRLVVWCAPPLCAAAAGLIPVAWWPLALLATLLQRDERV